MIKIRNQKELNELLDLQDQDYNKLDKLLNPKNRAEHLDKWLAIRDEAICKRGRRLLLADTRSQTWFQYIMKHWGDDEMYNWVGLVIGVKFNRWAAHTGYAQLTKRGFARINRVALRQAKWPFPKRRRR